MHKLLNAITMSFYDNGECLLCYQIAVLKHLAKQQPSLQPLDGCGEGTLEGLRDDFLWS